METTTNKNVFASGPDDFELLDKILERQPAREDPAERLIVYDLLGRLRTARDSTSKGNGESTVLMLSSEETGVVRQAMESFLGHLPAQIEGEDSEAAQVRALLDKIQ